MNLTESNKAEIQAKLQKLIQGTLQCPICHECEWTLSDSIFEMREFAGGSLVFGHQIYPVLTMTCNNCGNTIFFNAIKLGIVKTAEKTRDSGKE